MQVKLNVKLIIFDEGLREKKLPYKIQFEIKLKKHAMKIREIVIILQVYNKKLTGILSVLLEW